MVSAFTALSFTILYAVEASYLPGKLILTPVKQIWVKGK